MAADADIVLDTASDLTRAPAWHPAGDSGWAGDAREVRAVLDAALRALAVEVDQNFAAS